VPVRFDERNLVYSFEKSTAIGHRDGHFAPVNQVLRFQNNKGGAHPALKLGLTYAGSNAMIIANMNKFATFGFYFYFFGTPPEPHLLHRRSAGTGK
jgi:hypothetical protein